MAVRIEVQEGGEIEVMWPRPGASTAFMYFDDLEKALDQVRFFVKQDLKVAKVEMFESRLDAECDAELDKMIKTQRRT
jgi:hypothetical protein